MVLGLYYITKGRLSEKGHPVKGEGMSFFGPEEVRIAYNEGTVELHANIKVKVDVLEKGQLVNRMVETTVGRVLFNDVVPQEVGFINQLLTKKSLRDIIGEVVKLTGMARTAQVLEDIKEMGFHRLQGRVVLQPD